MTQGKQITGYEVVAKALARQGLTEVFGIVGVPIIELGGACQAEDMNYYGFRNEQAAAYAASAVGYMTKKPGVVLAVSGPGMTNCISGMANALVNKWPMICLGGAAESTFEGQGAFQEFDQLACAKPCTKYAARPNSIPHIPIIIERAVRLSTYGTPGPCYVDLPLDILHGKVDESLVNYQPMVTPLPSLCLPESTIMSACKLLREAQSPLVIVGKGIAYGDAAEEMRAFIDTSKIQFLATPMGKGVVSDYHELSAARARTYVLGNADVIFLCGARLNWILHFGLPPRFRKDVKIIQLDNDPFEMHTNVQSAVPMCADAKVALAQMVEGWSKTSSIPSPNRSVWTKTIAEKSAKNAAASAEYSSDKSVPMNYYTSQGIVQDEIAKLGNDYIIVAEGSNSMDIGRTVLMNNQPSQRLDAATFGTMGQAFGFGIATAALYPKKRTVMVLGDSSFGFSCMEIETAMRYRLPLKVVIINNNGIGLGTDEIEKDMGPKDISVLHLSPGAKYEQISIAFGGQGVAVDTPDELRAAMSKALNDDLLWVINCRIDPFASKKPQSHSWMTSKAEVKLAPPAKL